MADRSNWFFKQLVSESEMDETDAALEAADRNFAVDAAFNQGSLGSENGGIMTGLTVGITGPTAPVATGVRVLGAGSGYDNVGRRVRFPGSAPVTTIDARNAGSTPVGATGTLILPDGVDIQPAVNFERWVSIYIYFDRLLTDSRIDGTGTPVFFSEAESFRFFVKAGALFAIGTAPSTPDPPLEAGMLLLADVKMYNHNVFGLEYNTPDTQRRQDWLRATSPGTFPHFTLVAGNPRFAIREVLRFLNDYITGASGAQPASNVTYGGGAAWRDIAAPGATTNPAANVEVQLDKFITDLIAQTAGHSGAHKLGAAAVAGAPLALATGNVGDQIAAIVTRFNNHADGSADNHPATAITFAGSGNFADGVALAAQPAGSGVEVALDTLVSVLAATGNPSGADKVGSQASAAPGAPGTTGLVGLSAGRLFTQLVALKDGINGRVRRTGDTMVGDLTPSAASGAGLGSSALPWREGHFQNSNVNNPALALLPASELQDEPIGRFHGLAEGDVSAEPASVIAQHGHYQSRSLQWRDDFLYFSTGALADIYGTVLGGAGTVTVPSGNSSVYTGGVVELACPSASGEGGDLRTRPRFSPVGYYTGSIPNTRMHMCFRARKSTAASNWDGQIGFRRPGSSTASLSAVDDALSRVCIRFNGDSTSDGYVAGLADSAGTPNFAPNDTDWHFYEIIVHEGSPNPADRDIAVTFKCDGVSQTRISPNGGATHNGFELQVYEVYAHIVSGGAAGLLEIDFWEVYSDVYTEVA